MLSGVEAFGLVSWSQPFETWPPMPPSAVASAITAMTGTAATRTSSVRPAIHFACGDAGRSDARNPATSPSAVSATSISSSSAPSSWPVSARTGSGRLSVVRPVIENAHPTIAPPPAVAPSSTTALRSRSGTSMNQNASPTASASSAPRENESISATSSSPIPGQASALTAARPERRAPSQSSGRMPSAAVRPTAFQ